MGANRDLPAIGAILGGGKYRLDRRVGEGGMGAVYEATNVDTTRRVAIKILRPDLASRPDVLRRFAQEARAACRIEHPNIVGVFDLVQEGATVFIVEEFLEGDDLKQRIIAQGPMDAPEALRALLPVMEALAYAHGRGVVHRDIKPDNIFLSRSPRGLVPKVIDFGIARVVDDEGESLQGTSLGEVMGTAYYMSPEQARGDTELIDGRTDVWSLGAVLYYAVSGHRPFEATNRHQLMHRIATDPPTPLGDRARGLAPEFVSLVHRALARDLSSRFATMDAFLTASREVLAAITGRAGEVSMAAPEVSVSDAAQTLLSLELSSVDVLDAHAPEAVAALASMPALPIAHAPPALVTAPLRDDPQFSEATPASWETADNTVVGLSRHGLWGALFAVAIILGALVGVTGRAPHVSLTTSARTTAAPVRVPVPATPISLLDPVRTRDDVSDASVVVAAPVIVPSAPVVTPDAHAIETPQRAQRAARPSVGAARPSVRAARPSVSAARPSVSAAQLAPDPYGPRAMPPGLWAPR